MQAQLIDLEVPANEGEPLSSQPPNFRPHLQLLTHQLQSLHWMERREDAVQEESYCWPVCGGHGMKFIPVRGGVLADKIGTGKTCVGLALVDKARCPPANTERIVKEKIRSRATLVIVPPNICDQWRREVEKFIRPDAVRLLFAQDIGDVKLWSIADVEQSDLIIVSYRIFASRSYLPRRKQLEKDLSEDALNDESSACTKFPVFEIFHFHRIIFDEFHELVEASLASKKHAFREAAQSLLVIESTHRWGITSTPPLTSIQGVVAMAAFFQIELHPHINPISDFVSKLIRRNSTVPALVSLVQRKVLVAQSVHERALYLLRRREGVDRRDLLEFASMQWLWSASDVHGILRGSHDAAPTLSAQDICRSKLQELYRPIHKNTAKLMEAVAKFKTCDFKYGMNDRICSVRNIIDPKSEEELSKHIGSRKALQVLAHLLEDNRLDKEVYDPKNPKTTLFGVEGTRQTILSLTRALGNDYTTLLFFESSLDESDAGVDCPVCFLNFRRDECSIPDCGHTACSECWGKILANDPRCPICRESVTGSSLTTLSAGAQLKPETTGGGTALEIFGSKVACLLDVLANITAQDTTAKIVIFCQFEQLRRHVMKAFKDLSVQHVHVDGSTEQRGTIVRQFLSPAGPNTLVLSMSVSPSGLDLSVANHVIIVQPTCHDDGDDMKSVDFEAQSIGRCWRMGQERPVYVHRLCMASTVEECIVNHHMDLWCAKFGALQ